MAMRVGPGARHRFPPVSAPPSDTLSRRQDTRDVSAGTMDMVGKVPYPWPQCGRIGRTKSSDVRRKIRTETQDVLVLGEEGSTHGVQGINQ